MINKRGLSALIWILIIVVIIVVIALVVYMIMSGNGASGIYPSGGSIPTPPALPSG